MFWDIARESVYTLPGGRFGRLIFMWKGTYNPYHNIFFINIFL